MRNIRLVIEYDGTRYNGWQRLGKDSKKDTIQGKIEDVLKIMTGEVTIDLIASGRTDAGVHALAQIANFHSDTLMTCEEICRYLNRYLPDDIGVLSVSDVSPRFHSRFNARFKTYRYRIVTEGAPCVFDRRYVCLTEERLDLERMRAAAGYLKGIHDFRAFSTVKNDKKSTVREITSIDIYRDDREIVIQVRGTGFLRSMVRIISGTLMEVGAGQREPEEIPAILQSRQRSLAGATAPARGLTLVSVEY